MESARDLNDFERKLVTIIQHNSKRGKSPSIDELELRSGREANEIKKVTKDLIKRGWIGIKEGKLVAVKKLF